VTLDRDARLLREAFTRCRQDASVALTNNSVRNLIKRVEHGRVHLAEHMIAIAWDAFSRFAPIEDVEMPGHIYLAIVRSWDMARRRGERLDYRRALELAVEAQAEATKVEVKCLSAVGSKTLADTEDAMRLEIGRMEIALGAIEAERLRADRAA
jgi:hypothetical protein